MAERTGGQARGMRGVPRQAERAGRPEDLSGPTPEGGRMSWRPMMSLRHKKEKTEKTETERQTDDLCDRLLTLCNDDATKTIATVVRRVDANLRMRRRKITTEIARRIRQREIEKGEVDD